MTTRKMKQNQRYTFSIAPMMDWTDRHCRFFHRLLTRRALLYSEMITTGAIIHGDRARLLASDPAEQPVALQLGGCDPRALAQCAAIGEGFGFAEINLNVGCPSDRVQEGRFGACLMAEPALVGDCVSAMKARVGVPVTVKCRIGIDEQDPERALDALTAAVASAGVDALIVHARKAWLKGLSPRENRDVPPLDYDRVYRLKVAHARLPIVLNGGISSVEAVAEHLKHVDGVMMGRAAYQEPWRLLAVDEQVFGEAAPALDAKAAAVALVPYIERELARGVRLHAITRHVLGLFRGVPGARAFRRHLATEAVKPSASAETFCDALALIDSGMAARPTVDTVAA
jgi:tRNA-dihydrouridine synthase A